MPWLSVRRGRRPKTTNRSLSGRIGGSEKPFVDGLAAFTIVDLKVPYCADDEGCPTPWDYCCNQKDVNPILRRSNLLMKPESRFQVMLVNCWVSGVVGGGSCKGQKT